MNDVEHLALAERPPETHVVENCATLNDALSDISSEFAWIAQDISQLRSSLRFVDSSLRLALEETKSDLAPFKPELLEGAAIASACVREYLSSIHFWSPKVDRLWTDVALAQHGDLEAARRLSIRISWNPDRWQRKAIRLRARIQGTSPSEVQRSSLTKGVSLALGWGENQVFPILVQPQSVWLFNSDQTLSSVRPNDLPAPTFWEWIREEAVRAAGFWLVDLPYAPTVVLAEPPGENKDWRLAKFTSKHPPDTPKGRPYGSGKFENLEAFRKEITLAMKQVQSGDNRVTEERVAEVLSQRAILGSSDPVRQLRRLVNVFGFADWKVR